MFLKCDVNGMGKGKGNYQRELIFLLTYITIYFFLNFYALPNTVNLMQDSPVTFQ